MGKKRTPFFTVRRSPVHGLGAFAARKIRKGTRVAEYLGERISSEEGSRRYDDDASDSPHVLLFAIDEHTVLDAAVGGSDAQYVNHCCEPNCETEIIDGRAFIIALRTIREGEEITYDYHLDYEGEQTGEIRRKFACRCGAPTCRGTMLEPPAEEKKAGRKKRNSGKKAGSGKRKGKGKDGKKERRKDGKKEKRKDGKKERTKEGKMKKGKG
jgi:hypothetical protein